MKEPIAYVQKAVRLPAPTNKSLQKAVAKLKREGIATSQNQFICEAIAEKLARTKK